MAPKDNERWVVITMTNGGAVFCNIGSQELCTAMLVDNAIEAMGSEKDYGRLAKSGPYEGIEIKRINELKFLTDITCIWECTPEAIAKWKEYARP